MLYGEGVLTEYAYIYFLHVFFLVLMVVQLMLEYVHTVMLSLKHNGRLNIILVVVDGCQLIYIYGFVWGF